MTPSQVGVRMNIENIEQLLHKIISKPSSLIYNTITPSLFINKMGLQMTFLHFSLPDVSTYYRNGSFISGPDFPAIKSQYSNGLVWPCVSSIDEDIGFISVGLGYNSLWLTDSWKYNFKTGNFYSSSSSINSRLTIRRLWVRSPSNARWKWCQSYARFDFYTQFWFITEK